MARKKKASGRGSKNVVISNTELKWYIAEAKSQKKNITDFLEKESRKPKPQQIYHDYFFGKIPSIDAIATRLMEEDMGLIFVMVKKSGRSINVSAEKAILSSKGSVRDRSGTLTCQLDEYEGNSTTARYADSLCDLISNRFYHGTPQVRSLIPQSAVPCGRNVQITVGPHMPKSKSRTTKRYRG